MAVEGEFPKVDGDVLYASEANMIYHSRENLIQYTGSGFNSSQTGGAGTDTGSHELTALTATKIVGADYLRITIFVESWLVDNSNANNTLKIETKDVGGSYSDSLPSTNITTIHNGGINRATKTIDWLHTLTNDEKTNGVQVQITSTTTTTDAGGVGSVTNINTVVIPI